MVCKEVSIVCRTRSLEELLEWIRLKVEIYLDPRTPKDYVRVYCPKCLYDSTVHKSTLRRWRAKGKDRCCGVQLRLVDSEFFERKRYQCAEWYEVIERVLEKIFSNMAGRVVEAEVRPCSTLSVNLFPVEISVYRWRSGNITINMYIKERDDFHRFKTIVEAVTEAARGLSRELSVLVEDLDKRIIEEMARLGFRLESGRFVLVS
jgi:hypothetical protein